MGVDTSRRQLLRACAGTLLSGLVLSERSRAQEKGVGGVVALTDRVSLLTVGGTNVLALTGGDGLLLVDSGTPDLVPQ
jgi:hypothetical protein